MWPFKKKSADHALRTLTESLSAQLGKTLVSVLLYGSKASGEYRENRSDVNVFLVLENVSWETMELMAPSIRAWVKEGHPMPVVVSESDLPTYAHNLPIEFLDMKDHHKVLWGIDPLAGLTVDRAFLRAQCAQELSIKQVKLRQAILLANDQSKRLVDVLLKSLPGVLTVFRAALRLEADVPKGSKIDAARELAKRAGLDADCLQVVYDAHMRRRTDNVQDLARHYLENVDRALAYVTEH
jgi:hypothetical protein